MYFDRFDIVEAWYVWLCDHHDGQSYARSHPRYWSSYGRLSMMEHTHGFKPAPNLSFRSLSENGLEIYKGICARAGWCDCPR